MKKDFSVSWKNSKQPRKQRKYRFNAPLHIRQKLLSAHLDKALRKEYKKRSLPIRSGDEISVMTGEHRGKKGKVSAVDLKKLKVYVEGIVVKKNSGQETHIPMDPSNVVITKLKEDKKRMKFVSRKKKQ